MDIKKFITPLRKLEFVEFDPLNQSVHMYHSRIEEIGDKEKTLLVSEPYGKGQLLPRRYQEPYTVRIVADDCAYVFQASLLRYTREPFALWTITYPTTARRDQLRDFVRFNINLDVVLTAKEVAAKDGETPALPVVIKTLTRDISGNGMCILCPEDSKLAIGSCWNIVLPLSPFFSLEVEGEILRTVITENEKVFCGLRFTKIEEVERQKLIQFIYKKQIERRKKEDALFNDSI
ncbi:MAG: PilZ domain-containing protein [Sporomusaceae bacterium]|nr:PilZ domain-containing protein [Sporomusaceae bacterium]